MNKIIYTYLGLLFFMCISFCSCDSNKKDDSSAKVPIPEDLKERMERIKEHSRNSESSDNDYPQESNSGYNSGSYPANSNSYEVEDDNDYSPSPCQVCRMTGQCQVCDGSGSVMVKEVGIDGMQPQTCQACNGTGRCEGCNGTGYIQ